MARPETRFAGRVFVRPPLDEAAVAAVKALAAGAANPMAQLLALNFIIEDLAATYDLTFRPDELGGARETDLAEGRRLVGVWLRQIIMTPLDKLCPKTREKT